MKLTTHLLWSTSLAMAIGLTACGQKAGKAEGEKAPAENSSSTDQKSEATATASGDVIRIATEGAYPPMNFTNPDGSLGGFDIDVANALCQQMKAKCEIVAQDWDGIIPGLQAKKYDAIIAGMSITPERQEAVDFTDPYFSSGLILVAKADSDIDMSKLEGKTIGAQRSTVASTYLEDNNSNAKANLYDTQENAHTDLLNGRLDAVLVDQVVGTDWLSSEDAKGYEQKGASISTGKDDFGIAIRKGDELKAKFDNALKEIKGNGTYDKISQSYFNSATAQ